MWGLSLPTVGSALPSQHPCATPLHATSRRFAPHAAANLAPNAPDYHRRRVFTSIAPAITFAGVLNKVSTWEVYCQASVGFLLLHTASCCS